MQPMEFRDETRAQDVVSGDPGPCSRAISLPVNQILHASSMEAGAQQEPNGVGETHVDESGKWRRGSRGH